jgi:hypothetical protein
MRCTHSGYVKRLNITTVNARRESIRGSINLKASSNPCLDRKS